MSKWVLNVTFTSVASGRLASSGREMSRLCPPFGEQPKSFPDCDHHTWLPDGTVVGSRIWWRGSDATYAWPLCMPGPDNVYDVPFGCFQTMEPVSILESAQP